MGTVRRWKRDLERLLYVIRHAKQAWRLLEDAQEHEKMAKELRKQLNMPERVTFGHRPQLSWREAVLWMREYGIVLADGGAGFDYLARLSKDKWKHDIDPGADTALYSNWFLRRPEEADDICVWSKWPEIAVAQCVLNAKKAGVI